MILLLLCLFPGVLSGLGLAILILGFTGGTILKYLLMLTLVAIAPIVAIALIYTIGKKSTEKIRDVFRIEGKRFAHLCIITQVITAAFLIVLDCLDPYMIFFSLLPVLIYLILSVIFWVNGFYKGIMVSSILFVIVIILLGILLKSLGIAEF